MPTRSSLSVPKQQQQQQQQLHQQQRPMIDNNNNNNYKNNTNTNKYQTTISKSSILAFLILVGCIGPFSFGGIVGSNYYSSNSSNDDNSNISNFRLSFIDRLLSSSSLSLSARTLTTKTTSTTTTTRETTQTDTNEQKQQQEQLEPPTIVGFYNVNTTNSELLSLSSSSKQQQKQQKQQHQQQIQSTSNDNTDPIVATCDEASVDVSSSASASCRSSWSSSSSPSSSINNYHNRSCQQLFVDINDWYDNFTEQQLVDIFFVKLLQYSPTKLSVASYECYNNNNDDYTSRTIINCIGILNEENIGHVSFQYYNNIHQTSIVTFDAMICNTDDDVSISYDWIIRSIYKISDTTSTTTTELGNNNHQVPRIVWKITDRRKQQQQQQQRRYITPQQQRSTIGSDFNWNSVQSKYYEALVHPGMLILQQERNHNNVQEDKSSLSSSSSSSSEQQQLRVAIISKEQQVGDEALMYSRIQEEIFKYSTIDTLVTIVLPVSDSTSTTTSGHDDDELRVVISNRMTATVTTYRIDEIASLSDWLSTKVHTSLYDIAILLDGTSRFTTSASLEFLQSSVSTRIDEIVLETTINSLVADGIVIANAGILPISSDAYIPSNYFTSYDDGTALLLWDLARRTIINDDNNFEKIVEYSESIPCNDGRYRSHRFVIAMKDKLLLSNWVATEAEIALTQRKSTIATELNSDVTFQYIDGATMKAYEATHRIVEDMWCKDHDKDDDECYGKHGFDPDIPNMRLESSFEVRVSTVENGGRGVYTKTTIPNGAYLGLEEMVHGMLILPSTYSVLEKFTEYFNDTNDQYKLLFLGYIYGYGWFENTFGRTSAGVEPGIFTFANHGCGGTNNIGAKLSFTELSLHDDASYDEAFVNDRDEEEIDDIFADRHYLFWASHAVADIAPDHEVFDNYLTYGGKRFWETNFHELKSLCSGLMAMGSVSQYEQEKAAAEQS